jgi:rod shape determining protein RodA
MTRDFDWGLFAITILISLVGIMSIYSATHYPGKANINYSDDLSSLSNTFWIKQAIWLLLSLILAIFMANFNYHHFWDLAWFLYVSSVILLFLVLVVGVERSGAKRWFDLGIFSLQPSELVKISIIIILARYFTRLMSYHFSESIYHSGFFIFFKMMLVPIFLVMLPAVFIIKQPDLGSGIVLIPILFAIIFCAQVPKRFIASVVLLGAAVIPFFWHFLKAYQKSRFLVFLDPNIDPLGAGYTITQSKIAIGSGKLLGKGWLAGTQNQLNFLPERHTDFIFSIIAEEWGFIGSAVILFLLFFLIWRMIDIASKANDPFGRLISVGVIAFFSFQILINIAMTSGIMPVVGLPLPFVSYGGSSLLLSYFCIGLMLNISKHRIIF